VIPVQTVIVQIWGLQSLVMCLKETVTSPFMDSARRTRKFDLLKIVPQYNKAVVIVIV